MDQADSIDAVHGSTRSPRTMKSPSVALTTLDNGNEMDQDLFSPQVPAAAPDLSILLIGLLKGVIIGLLMVFNHTF